MEILNSKPLMAVAEIADKHKTNSSPNFSVEFFSKGAIGFHGNRGKYALIIVLPALFGKPPFCFRLSLHCFSRLLRYLRIAYEKNEEKNELCDSCAICLQWQKL
jgi:hypothetical protein